MTRAEIPYIRLAELLVVGHGIKARRGETLDVAGMFPGHAAGRVQAHQPQGAAPAKGQTWQAQLANVVLWNRLFGGKDLRPGAHGPDDGFDPIPKEPLASS